MDKSKWPQCHSPTPLNNHHEKLTAHIKQKAIDQHRLATDPILNNPTPMINAMTQMLTHHHTTFPRDTFSRDATVIAALGNSFSWPAHVIQYFSEHPPNTNWQRTRATIIPYSSSTLEPNQHQGYAKRPHPKGTPNPSTLAHVMAHLPHQPFTLVDMIKSGAGLAGFLTLAPQITPTLVFEPNTSVTQKQPLAQHPITHMAIPANQHRALELACDEGIRGSIQTKIYEPPPGNAQDRLFLIKKSHLIQAAKNHLNSLEG